MSWRRIVLLITVAIVIGAISFSQTAVDDIRSSFSTTTLSTKVAKVSNKTTPNNSSRTAASTSANTRTSTSTNTRTTTRTSANLTRNSLLTRNGITSEKKTPNASLSLLPLAVGDESSLVHHHHLPHLPLLSWENHSMVTRKCIPPRGVPKHCCIGSASAGGGNNFTPENCRKDLAVYNLTARLAIENLQNNPIERVSGQEPVMECDVCRIADMLLDQNLSIAFVGDSVMRQNFAGLECEFVRRNYQAPLVKVQHNATDPRWRFGVKRIEALHISRNSLPGRSASFYFYACYRPVENMEEIAWIAQNHDVLVFDHGLHYNFHKDFRQPFVDMSIGYLNVTYDKVKLLMWRETPTQHFNTSDGDWDETKRHEGCHPLKSTVAASRERLHYGAMVEALEKSAIPQDGLIIIPFRDFTSDLHALHPWSKGGTDCTHFCSTPYVFLPVWRRIRLEMEKKLLTQ